MRLVEAQMRQRALQGDPVAVSHLERKQSADAERRARDARDWAARRVAEINRDVRRTAQRRKHQADLENIRSTFARLRRAEESLTLSLARALGTGPYSSGLAWLRWAQLRQEGVLASLPVGDIAHGYAEHVRQLLQQHDIEAEWSCIPGVNAYAFAASRRVELSPVVSPNSYVTALHEISHVLLPCEKTAHVRVASGADTTVCVRCEIAAWQNSIQIAQPSWSPAMHGTMVRCLNTYMRYATPEERSEIESMTSQIGFQRVRLQRATTGAQK